MINAPKLGLKGTSEAAMKRPAALGSGETGPVASEAASGSGETVPAPSEAASGSAPKAKMSRRDKAYQNLHLGLIQEF